MCARRLETRWQKLPGNTQITVCDSTHTKVGSTVLTDWVSTGDQWTELLGVLFQASQSPEAGLRETAFRIFTTTPGVIEKQHEDAVLGVFTKGFEDDNISVCSALSAGKPRGVCLC